MRKPKFEKVGLKGKQKNIAAVCVALIVFCMLCSMALPFILFFGIDENNISDVYGIFIAVCIGIVVLAAGAATVIIVITRKYKKSKEPTLTPEEIVQKILEEGKTEDVKE